MKIDTQDLEQINQKFDEIHDPLEPLKVASAFNSQLMVLDYRLKHKPKDVSPLDYTILIALQRQIPHAAVLYTDTFQGVNTSVQQNVWLCPECGDFLGYECDEVAGYCSGCGQRIMQTEEFEEELL